MADFASIYPLGSLTTVSLNVVEIPSCHVVTIKKSKTNKTFFIFDYLINI